MSGVDSLDSLRKRIRLRGSKVNVSTFDARLGALSAVNARVRVRVHLRVTYKLSRGGFAS